MRLLIDLQGAQGPSRTRGIGRLSLELALAMASAPRGHEVMVALSAAYAEDRDRIAAAFSALLPPTAILTWASPGGTADITRGSALRRAAAEHIRAEALTAARPDIIHVSSLFEGLDSDIVVCWPTDLRRPPTVATFYDAIPLIHREAYLDGAWRDSIAGPYLRRAQQALCCDALLAISESSRQEAIDHIGASPDDVFVVDAGVGGTFRPTRLTPSAHAVLLDRYGLRDGFVLFLGAGDLRKNVSGLMAAYASLPRDLKDAHPLVVVGGEPHAHAADIARNRLGADVTTIPFVAEADMPALYSACTLFVLPSLHEGFGLPAAEAMACGAPVIASNTSSLPEVVGRADALFDPRRPEDIAALMTKALTDRDFRSSLATHGPVQAARFTWEAAAQRAWQALEAVHARTANRPGRARGRRLTLAYVSPLPPDESGIADYSRDLLPALGRHYDITLVTSAPVTDTWLAANFPVIGADALLAGPHRFDRVLYQVGNSEFHLPQVRRMIPALPGVSVLHDAYLSGVLAFHSPDPSKFAHDLFASHGYPAVAYLAAESASAAARRYPCNLPVLRGSVGVIQHSSHARSILARHYGARLASAVRLIPFARRKPMAGSRAEARAKLGIPADVFVACSFGMVADSKLPEVIVEAWREAGLPKPARLVFVGGTIPDVERRLRSALSAAGERVADALTERVPSDIYGLWLNAADLAIQLRTGSRGETSGAVMDCLAAGLPTIVNAHGSMSELPADAVLMLPDAVTPRALGDAIRSVHADTALRSRLSEAARRHAETVLHPVSVAARYREAIEAAYAAGPVVASLAVMKGLRDGPAPADGDLPATAMALARSFPLPRPPIVLVDVTHVPESDTPFRMRLAAWLRGHGPFLRVEPVLLSGGHVVLARRFAWGLLGVATMFTCPADEPAEIGADCTILLPRPELAHRATITACMARGARVLSSEVEGWDGTSDP